MLKKILCGIFALALAASFPATVHGQVIPICNNQVTVQTAQSTSVVAVTGVAGTTTYICGVIVSGVTAAGLFSIIEGTGTTCGTNTLGIIGTGSLQHSSQVGVALAIDSAKHRTLVLGNDVCLKAGAGSTITLTLSYIQRQ